MDVLLHNELFLHFFNNISNQKPDDLTRALKSIIYNKYNNIVFNRYLDDYLINEISNDHNKELYRQFLVANQAAFYNITITPCDKLDINFKNLITNYNQKPLSKVVTKLSLNSSSEYSGLNVAIYSENFIKTTFDWFVFNISSIQPNALTYRYYEFEKNSQISELIDFVIRICNPITSIDLFYRQSQFENYFFEKIPKTLWVNYYTCFLKNQVQKIERSEDLKKRFPKSKIMVASNATIHERQVLLNNLIIESDDDFENIDVSRKTWRINITYCPATFEKLSTKKDAFIKETL